MIYDAVQTPEAVPAPLKSRNIFSSGIITSSPPSEDHRVFSTNLEVTPEIQIFDHTLATPSRPAPPRRSSRNDGTSRPIWLHSIKFY